MLMGGLHIDYFLKSATQVFQAVTLVVTNIAE